MLAGYALSILAVPGAGSLFPVMLLGIMIPMEGDPRPALLQLPFVRSDLDSCLG